jgi:Right handed beta helix region
LRPAWAPWGIAALFLVAAMLLMRPTGNTRTMRFPEGVTEVHSEIPVEANTVVHGVAGRTILRAATDFQGRAIFVVRGDGVRIRDLEIDGNRDAIEVLGGLPASDMPFERFTRGNGVLAAGITNLEIENVSFSGIAGFAVLVSRGRQIAIDRVRVTDGGSRNAAGRNNTTGGILIEEGTTDFRVSNCELRGIRGNGVWTHSLYTSPRNARGVFEDNVFDTIGRDALQVGHATAVRVERNRGTLIGFPVDVVDVEGRAIPVAVDTAGNGDASL